MTCEGCQAEAPDPGSDLLPRLCLPCFRAAVPGWLSQAAAADPAAATLLR